MSSTEDLEMVNFQGYFMWLMKKAKENAPENNGISVKARRGDLEAEITYTPPPAARWSGRSKAKPKPLNLLGAQGVVAEYPDLLEQPSEAEGGGWWIGTKRGLGDHWKEINGKLQTHGFTYVRWDESKPKITGGWRADK